MRIQGVLSGSGIQFCLGLCHTWPPLIGSAPTLRPRTPPAARRPDLNDAQHAAMTLHSTTFCAIHKCSTLHTARTRHARHARSMSTRPGRPTRGTRATRAAARASIPQSPRQTRSRSRHGHEVANKVLRSCGYARRPGIACDPTLPATANDADGTRAGGIPRRTASTPMPTAATGAALRPLTPSWAACAAWSAAERMPSWAFT